MYTYNCYIYYMYIYVYVYICIYMYVYICACIYIYINSFMHCNATRRGDMKPGGAQRTTSRGCRPLFRNLYMMKQVCGGARTPL